MGGDLEPVAAGQQRQRATVRAAVFDVPDENFGGWGQISLCVCAVDLGAHKVARVGGARWCAQAGHQIHDDATRMRICGHMCVFWKRQRKGKMDWSCRPLKVFVKKRLSCLQRLS